MIPAAEPIVVGLTEDSNMGCKPILDSTTDVPEPAIIGYVRRGIIEPFIHSCETRVYRVISRAGENTAAPAKYVWRQVNTRPEIIQRESQDEISRDHTSRLNGRCFGQIATIFRSGS